VSVVVVLIVRADWQAMVDVAKEVGADAVSHGCTGKGNDQACFQSSYYCSYCTLSCQLYYSD